MKTIIRQGCDVCRILYDDTRQCLHLDFMVKQRCPT